MLQNSVMNERKIDFTLQKPFDSILSANTLTTWLRWLKAVRTFFIEQILTPTLNTEVDIAVINNCFRGNQPALKLATR